MLASATKEFSTHSPQMFFAHWDLSKKVGFMAIRVGYWGHEPLPGIRIGSIVRELIVIHNKIILYLLTYFIAKLIKNLIQDKNKTFIKVSSYYTQ